MAACIRSAGVIFAYSRNFCSADLASGGLAVSRDFCMSKEGVDRAPGNEMDMANSGRDCESRATAMPDVKRWKMSLCIELRAHRTGQILPDHAPTKQTMPR